MNTIIISASLVIFATIIGLYYMYKDNHQEQPLWSFSQLGSQGVCPPVLSYSPQLLHL